MFQLNRRSTSFWPALSAATSSQSSFCSHPGSARRHSETENEADPCMSASDLAPGATLLDFNWRFLQGHGCDPARDLAGFHAGDFNKTGGFEFALQSTTTRVAGFELPHDWRLNCPSSTTRRWRIMVHRWTKLSETSVGWYRRVFDVPRATKAARIPRFRWRFSQRAGFLQWNFIGRNDNGYVPFRFDLTISFLWEKNCITVRVMRRWATAGSTKRWHLSPRLAHQDYPLRLANGHGCTYRSTRK